MALAAVTDTLGAADLPSSAFCQEDSCSPGELSLRQLRATKSLVPGEEADVEASLKAPPPSASDLEDEDLEASLDASPPESDGPLGMALPGGWGEAAEAAEHLDQGLVDQYRVSYEEKLGANWNATFGKEDPEEELGNGPSGRKLMTLYHQTGYDAGPLILANGFKPGLFGWCGGGIYFATSPLETERKAIGSDSHIGFMIKATVDVGRIKYMGRQCNKKLNGEKLENMGYDSVSFNPSDGQEYVVYSSDRVLSTVQIPYHCSRRCHFDNYKTVCTKCR
ncbi:unnamed protein product [Polarella glacialis]|uniref:PARP n=1 Tax=Polarella glacialis TaxID=89957 RepID=A0A813FG53_POLGL|nr:unnamed protein product [Polarella glacialis]